ncbi:MAG: transcription-repair coupling factor [Anaerolineae bacterium]|nr:transcription-repair coupling factor [Anaerolineae bacterium]
MPLRGITDLLLKSPALDTLARALREPNPPLALGLPRAARPFVVAALAQLGWRALYVVSSVEASRIATETLSQLAPISPLRLAEPNTAFFDTVAPAREVISQRSAVLAALAAQTPGLIVVASPRALMQPVLPADRFRAETQTIRHGTTIRLDALLESWLRLGYEPESIVDRVGTFSRRGGILDLWSPAHPLPARIELFGDEVDSLRLFDPATQRSTQPLDELTVTPLDVPKQGSAAESSSLLSYLSSGALALIDDEDELCLAWNTLAERAERERATLEAPATTQPYLDWSAFASALQRTPHLVLGQPLEGLLEPHPLAKSFAQPPHFAGQFRPLLDYLNAAIGERSVHAVVVSRQAARLAELWGERSAPLAAHTTLDEPPHPGLTFVVGALPGGFLLDTPSLVLLTDAEIYSYMRSEWFTQAQARKRAPERAFADWRIGDAVVHEDYGIGLYRGLVRLTVAAPTEPGQPPVEHEREYLLLEYAEGDRLYVPLHQLDRVHRYVGADDAQPKLDQLGSGSWEKARQKASAAAAALAREMLELYARRELAERPPFAPDTPWQTEMEASFPFIETEDQLRAIQEVKADMESPRPMDRLVVGDVGFGKTEVALRAAFKAVQDGRQVAVLVPTTVLAQQHWNTFSRRLASYPVRVEMLSRFCTPAEKRQVLAGLADGSVDIVIGTHALLSKDVTFKNLGLLIVDEEHRFGVAAKERLKQVRTEVDVLTLTATPIPRTLYLGLSGIRPISRIETPPAERLPVITFVGAWDEAIVRQAIRRELDRDGQVFFVHNRVQTIGTIQSLLARLVPEARIVIAHGQMDERELARAMTRFAEGGADILLCTNIIESGLDIPNANTLIVESADHFGLAELHQLRGRVGRSNMQAYAYFFYDRRGRITDEARQRLETLRESSGLGAGYAVALRDLELRGAGDLLGSKQSGHISAVGFDLYTRLLAQEVARLRALRDGTPPPPETPKAVTIDLPLNVGLPEDYVGDAQLRVQLYRRAAELDSEAAIRAFEEELEDRFGKLPPPARNLTFQLRLKLLANALGATSITTEGGRITIRAEVLSRMDPNRLQLIVGQGGLVGRTQVSFLRSGTPDQWKQRLVFVLERLVELKERLALTQRALAAAAPQRRRVATPTDLDKPLPPITQDVDW